MFVQFILDASYKGYQHLIDLYDEESESWRLPYDEFIEFIEKHTEEDS